MSGRSSLAELSEPELIACVFIACAASVTRLGRQYDEWLHEVNRRFAIAWRVIDTGSLPTAELESGVAA